MANACIFLSAKVEEHPKKIRDIINVFHHVIQKREGIENPEPIDVNKQVFIHSHHHYNYLIAQ